MSTKASDAVSQTKRRKQRSFSDWIVFPWVLSLRLWLPAVVLWAAFAWGIPAVYRQRRPAPDIQARAAFADSDDYWVFRARAARAASENPIVLLGDSVVWGQYVADEHTLSSAMNRRDKGRRFVNLGVNGLHPAAMRGMLRHHGRDLTNTRTIVFCNLLWMSSPRHDLTQEEPASFNHPDLIPQFLGRPPTCDAGIEQRISRVAARYLTPMIWARHIRIRYLGNQDIFRWMYDNPYTWPSTAPREEPALAPGVRPVSWQQGGLRVGPMNFVEPDESFQWASFLDSLELLARRGNDILVVMLPFNEHMLTEPGLSRYRAFQDAAVETLQGLGPAVLTMDVLESDLYGDASHPLAEGYEIMAEELLANPVFLDFVVP